MSKQRMMALITLVACSFLSIDSACHAQRKRTPPPTRKFDAPGSPTFVRLDAKAGLNPPLDVDGDFLIGPEYSLAPENEAVGGVPQGKVQQFTIDSKDTKLLNPGIARKVFGTVDPKNPKTLIVETIGLDQSTDHV